MRSNSFTKAKALLCAVLVAAVVAEPVLAQSFPGKTVRIVVPFPAGGTVDVLGRALAQKLGEKWKQGVIVENMPGAGTVLGTDLVAKAAPDGHTILLAVTAHAVNATLYSKLPFDPIRDFAGISMVATTPNILVMHPAAQVNTVAS